MSAPAPAGPATTDPRVALLLSEAFRHGKAIGAWAGGEAALEAAGVPTDAPGVVLATTGTSALEQVTTLLGGHRVWERFTTRV
jgi:catalase